MTGSSKVSALTTGQIVIIRKLYFLILMILYNCWIAIGKGWNLMMYEFKKIPNKEVLDLTSAEEIMLKHYNVFNL